MKYVIQLISLIALVFTVNTALARNGPKPPPAPEPVNLENVVTVSGDNGDFESPVAALNSIGDDAAEDNQYVIQIGPGVYDIGEAQIEMKPWVKIEGAGRMFTIIKGSRSSSYNDEDAAMIIGANKALLIGIGIENTGSGDYSTGIRNDNTSPSIKNVRVSATGSVTNIGISMSNSYSQLVNVKTHFYDDVNINSSDNYIGIWMDNNSLPKLLEVSTAPLSYNGTGVVVNNSAPFIVDSELVGKPGLELADVASGKVVNNLIVGGVLRAVTNTGGTVCRGNYDENLGDVVCAVTTLH